MFFMAHQKKLVTFYYIKLLFYFDFLWRTWQPNFFIAVELKDTWRLHIQINYFNLVIAYLKANTNINSNGNPLMHQFMCLNAQVHAMWIPVTKWINCGLEHVSLIRIQCKYTLWNFDLSNIKVIGCWTMGVWSNNRVTPQLISRPFVLRREEKYNVGKTDPYYQWVKVNHCLPTNKTVNNKVDTSGVQFADCV